MRGGRLIPLGVLVSIFALSVLYYGTGAWRKMLDSRIITGIKIRQLSAIANNLTRIIRATETESAILNRDINRFLHLVERHVQVLRKSNASRAL